MDYALPRAADFPDIEVDLLEVPSVSNPLGVKGAGEAGSVGSPPALINAIIDALSVDGVTHIDMPATPESVWQALSKARSGQALSLRVSDGNRRVRMLRRNARMT